MSDQKVLKYLSWTSASFCPSEIPTASQPSHPQRPQKAMVKEDRSDWVAVEGEHANIGDKIVKGAKSAWFFFQKNNTTKIKQELILAGKESDFGSVATAVSQKWKAMGESEREQYQKLHLEDKARYGRESAQRDAEIEAEQAARREAAYGAVEEGSRRSTVAASSQRSEDLAKKRQDRQPRVVSEAVKQLKAEKKRIKQAKDTEILKEQEKLRKEKAKQAKQRLDYLLQQSDIFSHFGKVQDESASFKSPMKSSNGGDEVQSVRNLPENCPPSPSKRDRSASDVGNPEIQEDDENEGVLQTTYLTKQPNTMGDGNPPPGRPAMKMRPYQLEGLNWMIKLQEKGVNGILADEMGLGKTLQSLSILVFMKEFKNICGPHLVIVPKSTLSNWMNELKRWAPTLKGVRFHGSKDEREVLMNEVLKPGQPDHLRDWDVIVTTYEIVNMEKNLLKKFAWQYLIIDEAHRLKNEASMFSQNIRLLQTRYRLLLTGTPLQNNLHELWALLNFLVPDVFSSADQFDEWFNLDIDDAESKTQLIGQLHKILRPFMLRRLKADVEKTLPPKHETILFVGMSAMQKKLYKDILLRDIDMIQGGSSGDGGRTAVLNIVMQLRKAAGHPYLFPGQEDRTLPPLGGHIVENCGKMVLLDKLLVRLKDRGHRVLIFSQMTKILDILEDFMVMRQHSYCRIDGNTTYEDRENAIETYNRLDSKKFIFLLSTRAGGLGINLQTADTVILFDSDWNPQADLQAQDRAHRIGQTKTVQVFRLVTENTIEEKIVERAQQKLKLDAMVVQSGRLKEKDKLSNDELLASIRFGADKVFKSNDSSITDDDIDMILDVGKKRTEEMNAKLQNAEKGDLLDFTMDGGMSAQTYEGVDYSSGLTRAEQLGLFDIGKRERKPVKNYNEKDLAEEEMERAQNKAFKKPKESRFPKHLRLKRMEDWQLFDRDRLRAIADEEEKIFNEILAIEGGFASIESQLNEPTFQLLKDEAVITEKAKLQREGYPKWNRADFMAFIKHSSKFGRTAYERICQGMGNKLLEEVKDFSLKFWDPLIGKARISEKEYDRAVLSVERGEKKLVEIKNMETATSTLLAMFQNPWQNFQWSKTTARDRQFTAEEDRFLICCAEKYGHGQWEAIRLAIRRKEAFRFDYHFRSMTTHDIGKRCEMLMRAAEREVEQLQKEYWEKLSPSEQLTTRQNQVKLPKRRNEESNNLNNKKSKAEKDEEDKFIALNNIEAKLLQRKNRLEAGESVAEIDAKQAAEDKERARIAALETSSKKQKNSPSRTATGKTHGKQPALLSDEQSQALANLVAVAGFQAKDKIIADFAGKNPGASKRQIGIKIDEISTKEKRADFRERKPTWHIRPEFQKFLNSEAIEVLNGRLKAAGVTDKKVFYVVGGEKVDDNSMEVEGQKVESGEVESKKRALSSGGGEAVGVERDATEVKKMRTA